MSGEYMPIVYFVCANCGRKLYGCNTRHPDHADGPNRGMNRCAQSDKPGAEAQATPVRLRGAFADRATAVDQLDRVVGDLVELAEQWHPTTHGVESLMAIIDRYQSNQKDLP